MKALLSDESLEAAAVLAQHRPARSSRWRRKCWPARLRRRARTSIAPIAHLDGPCGSTTAWSTPSRPSFTTRRATRSAPSCSRPGARAEAETVYWEDLRRNRENGWALFGLMQALRAQNKTADAALTEARFKKAWARADVTLDRHPGLVECRPVRCRRVLLVLLLAAWPRARACRWRRRGPLRGAAHDPGLDRRLALGLRHEGAVAAPAGAHRARCARRGAGSRLSVEDGPRPLQHGNAVSISRAPRHDRQRHAPPTGRRLRRTDSRQGLTAATMFWPGPRQVGDAAALLARVARRSGLTSGAWIRASLLNTLLSIR